MKPVVFLHGYSAEPEGRSARAIAAAYGSLPRDLRRALGGAPVVDIDLSRYTTLEDGLSLEDVSRALEHCLRHEHPGLLRGGFHAITHSAGALVLRNWLRRHSARPSPLDRVVHLAGAAHGSGWAHIGQGQFVRWGSELFLNRERGIRLLHALELGASWTLDLNRWFLQEENDPQRAFRVREHCISGTHADPRWFQFPVRFAKEDGSDGVVRVAASNVDSHHLDFGATRAARELPWSRLRKLAQRARRGRPLPDGEPLYELRSASRPGQGHRGRTPLAIPYACAHSGEGERGMGIVRGERPRAQLLRLLDFAFRTRAREASRVERFARETANSYDMMRAEPAGRWRGGVPGWDPRHQYDAHAQLVLRLRDQDGRPVEHFDVFFRSPRGAALEFGQLVEHKHLNSATPGILVFYLRLTRFDAERGEWLPRLPEVGGMELEITATEPETGEVLYLPFRHAFDLAALQRDLVPHRTTVVDVELLRLPGPGVFTLARLP